RPLRTRRACSRGPLTAAPAAQENHLAVEACHVRSPRLPTRKFGRSGGLVQNPLILANAPVTVGSVSAGMTYFPPPTVLPSPSSRRHGGWGGGICGAGTLVRKPRSGR